jgi:hypothetical protein
MFEYLMINGRSLIYSRKSDKIRAGLINNQQISWTNLLVTAYQYDTCNTTKLEAEQHGQQRHKIINTVQMTNRDGDSLSNTLLSTKRNGLRIDPWGTPCFICPQSDSLL